ncbi:hypothetical protein D1AOALGA4SA_10997, partial [Olavius algarvensis Delta 1 endosymbiont]
KTERSDSTLHHSIFLVRYSIFVFLYHFSMYTIGAAVADAAGGGGGGTCFIAAARRAETVFFIGNWSDISICGLLILIGFFCLKKRRKGRR